MSPSDGLVEGTDGLARCWWGAGDSALYRAYHDDEWGQPVLDDRLLFEKICLEGFQSGLSWLTILRKRDDFRRAFAGFEMAKVSAFGEVEVEQLLADASIVRHRGKIRSAIANAARALELIAERGSLGHYLWSFEPHDAERPARVERAWLEANAQTPASRALAADLRRRGWTFVGPTTSYALMQASGIVNDHLEGCHARAGCAAARAGLGRSVAG